MFFIIDFRDRGKGRGRGREVKRERERGRERERSRERERWRGGETSIAWLPFGCQPGIEPATFWHNGQLSDQLKSPIQGDFYVLL